MDPVTPARRRLLTTSRPARADQAEVERADPARLHPAGSVNGRVLLTDQLCQRCGHPPCPCCWACGIYTCDELVRDEDGDPDLCCDGECAFASPPRIFDAEGEPWIG